MCRFSSQVCRGPATAALSWLSTAALKLGGTCSIAAPCLMLRSPLDCARKSLKICGLHYPMVVSTRRTDPSDISIRPSQASFPCLNAGDPPSHSGGENAKTGTESTIVNLLHTHISHAFFSGSTVFAAKLTPTAASTILEPSENAARLEGSSTNPSAFHFYDSWQLS